MFIKIWSSADSIRFSLEFHNAFLLAMISWIFAEKGNFLAREADGVLLYESKS